MPKIFVKDIEIECKLVLFDLDGTLVDKDHRSKALAKTRYTAIRRLAGEEAAKRWAYYSGVDIDSFTVDENGPLSKAPRNEDLTVATTAIWLNGLNWFKAKEIATEAYRMADLEQSQSYKSKLIPGTEDALKKMHATGLQLGIATNGSGKTAREIMTYNRVEGLFDVYIGADEVAEGKPEPDLIIEACRRVGLKPSMSVYVGDELVDAVAGTGAGVAGIVIVSSVPDVSGYTDLVVGSVADISVNGSSKN